MMIFNEAPRQSKLQSAITDAYRRDETECIKALIPLASFSNPQLEHIHDRAYHLVEGTRKRRKEQGGLDAFMRQYDLSSEEGIALMCMAEALLRIPDSNTIDRLISDKISTADWEKHLNNSDSLFVNAATWSLLLTGKIYSVSDKPNTLAATFKKLLTRTSSHVIRPIILQGMKIIGKQFVMGTTIEEALERAKKLEATGYRYSYDMLGEAARTRHDAEIYLQSYQHAIKAIGEDAKNKGPIESGGVSIKLSALHPRYEVANTQQVMQELVPTLLALAQLAKQYNISLTVDAEEADRLELSLNNLAAGSTQKS